MNEAEWLAHAEYLIKRGYPTLTKDPKQLAKILEEKSKSDKAPVNTTGNIAKP